MTGDLKDMAFFVMTPDDYDEATTLLNDHFFRRNPLSRAAGQLDVKSYSRWLVADIKKCLASGVSIGARDNISNSLAGIFLNSSFNVDEISTKCTGNMESLCVVYCVLEKLSIGAQVFKDMKVQRVLDLFTLCVHEDYGRRGLGKRLVEESLSLGREQGHQAASIQITNNLTEKICTRLGFHTVKSIDLSTEADELGIDISLLSGKNLVQTMVKRL